MTVTAELIASWVATGLVGFGLVLTWVRNGKSHAKHMAKVEAKVDEVKVDTEELKKGQTDQNKKMDSIEKEISSINVHCAGVTAGFEARLRTSEAEIDVLRRKKRV